MIRILKITSILLIAFTHFGYTQNQKQIDSLCKLCQQAATDSDQVMTLSNLAKYYYANKLDQLGDSVFQEQIHIAELSNNSSLILKTYFDNSIANISSWTTTKNFEKAISFAQKGLDYAYSQNAYDYIVRGHTALAGIYRKKGEADKALYNAQKGVSYLQYVKSDSVKAIMYIELGDVYQAKGESVLACTNYNNAFDIAIKSNNRFLESTVDHHLAELYIFLGDTTEAKSQLINSLNINKELKNGKGMVMDYLDLARHTDDLYFIKKAIALSDSLHLNTEKIYAKRIMLAYYMVKLKNSDVAIKYLNSEPDLKQSILVKGMANYYWNLAEIYRYANNADSALHYFNLSKNDMLRDFDKNTTQYFYWEVAVCYALKNDIKNAIENYETSLQYSKELQNLSAISETSDSLSVLYQKQGDFKNAYAYKTLATATKDSLQKLSKDRDIALLGVVREKNKHDELVKNEQNKFIEKRNLQYMAITIAIGVVFVFMLFLGMFPVSKFTIKMLGYFFFISVFEFIVLLIDTLFLSKATHNEPLKLWLIKIALIALLVPFQHLLEHGLTKFLASRKLMEVKKNISIKRWLRNLKKPATKSQEADLEEDTAVL